MKRPLLSLLLLLTSVFYSEAQNRYFGEVFGSVSVTTDVVYGNNITVLTGNPVAEDLHMDVYEPDGDTETARPVVIIVHDGSMLPTPVNIRCVGSKTDNSVVEIATRLAKYGYVVAAIDYRLGWNPVAPTQDQRTGTYINSLYRGMQDIRNAVRYFRWSQDNGNPYAIDAEKISVVGEGTGAELAVWAGAFDRYEEMDLPKYLDLSTFSLYVDSAQSGNVYGTNNRPLNVANYPTYSSDISFVGSLGGAVGDSTWIEAGEPPIVTMHCPSDPFIPYGFGAYIVATTAQFVVNVSGSHDVQRISNALGNNDIYISATLSDTISQLANVLNEGLNGHYPFIRSWVENGPWQWWDTTCQNNTESIATNPDMSETKAQAYMDTIMAYMAPRMALSNGFIDSGLGMDERRQRQVKIYPNPATDGITVTSMDNKWPHTLVLVDLAGRTMLQQRGNGRSDRMDVSHLSRGTYLLQLWFEDEMLVNHVVIQ